MKYESYNEYINNPISKATILKINEILAYKDLEVVNHFKNTLYKYVILSFLCVFLAILSKVLFNSDSFELFFCSLTLIFFYKICTYKKYSSEVKLAKPIDEEFKIEIKNGIGEYYDFLGQISGNTISGIRTMLKTELNFKPKYYEEDFEKLKSNIGDRNIYLFEYGILNEKYKEMERGI